MIERPQTIWKSGSLALLLLAVFCLLVLFPLFLYLAAPLLPDAIGGLGIMRDLLRSSHLQHAALHTLAVALLACGLASIVAIPAAFLAVRLSLPARLLIQVLGFLPLTMPPFLSAAVLLNFTGIIDQTGAIASFAGLGLASRDVGLILVFAVHYLPFILFCLIAGLSRIDRSVTESARNLGAGRLLVLRRITLPLLTPAYVLGASLMILRIFEDIGTPLMLGIDRMLAPQILLRLAASGLSDPMLNAAALVLLGASIVVAVLAWSALARPLDLGRPTPCSIPMRWHAEPGSLLISLPLLLGLGILALAPHLWLILMAVGADWSSGLIPPTLDTAQLPQFLATSVAQLDATLAYIAGAGALTLLTGGAYAALSWQPGTLGRLVRFASTLLFAIPGVVLALGYANVLERFAPHLPAGPGAAWLALMLVIALKHLPVAERILAGYLRAMNEGSIASTRNLGAPGLSIGLRIGLPALRGTFAGIFLLGCAAATVELSAALLLLEDTQAPLALSLFRALQSPAGATAGAAQGLLMIGLTACILLLSYWLLHRHCHHAAPHSSRQSAVTRKDS